MEDTDLSNMSRMDIIEHLAGINYGPREIALYLREETRAFKNKWEEPNSPERQAYDRGLLITQATIDIKLAEQAKGGNMTAAQIYKKSRVERDWEDAFK